MEKLIEYREKYYKLGRISAVFLIAPFLIFSGKKYDDRILITIGVLLIIWDGFKLIYG